MEGREFDDDRLLLYEYHLNVSYAPIVKVI